MSKRKLKAIAIMSHLPGQLFLLWFVFYASYDSQGNRHFTLFDDAMISMTYAKTLAMSGKFLWHPEAEVVQGFTNLLWTLFMYTVHSVGFNGPDASLVVSLTGVLVITLLSTQIQSIVAKESTFKPELSSNIAATTTYFIYPTTFWTLRGMEVGIQALVLILLIRAIVAIHHSRLPKILLHGSIFGLVLTGIGVRIDFAIPVSAILCFYAIGAIRGAQQKFVPAIVLAASLVIGILIVLLSQNLIWGDFLPNTYYLKVDGFGLQDRVERGAWNLLKFLPLLGIIGLAWILMLRSGSLLKSKELVGNLAIGFFSMAAYSIYVGGDAWEAFLFANRYLSMVLPSALIITFVSSPIVFRALRLKFKDKSLALGGGIFATSGALLGFQTNPFSFNFLLSAMGVIIFFFSFCLLLLMTRVPIFARVLSPAALALPALVTILVSAIPISLLFNNGIISSTESDARMTEFGIALRDITEPDARIATLWAGAPAYYSERKMVDLLGKSDKELARSSMASLPEGFWNSEFYPGHNKYDLEYSIRKWKPDVVAQTLGLPGESSVLEAFGYEKYCITTRITQERIYVSEISERVLRASLEVCK